MRVSTRLNLAVLPALLGLLLVAALAYWGERGRQAPQVVLAVAVVAAIASLAVSWWNARFLAARVERLARLGPTVRDRAPDRLGRGDPDVAAGVRHGEMPDELDQIASTVTGLTHAVESGRAEADLRVARAEGRAAEYAEILGQAVRTLGARTREAHLPLHILLSSPFGELNENQEELLGDACDAVASADTELRLLDRLIALDRDARTPAAEPVTVETLVQSPLAIARAHGAANAASIRVGLPETLPRVVVDVSAVQEALTALLLAALGPLEGGGELLLAAQTTGDGDVRLSIAPPPTAAAATALAVRLAQRLLRRASEGFQVDDQKIEIRLKAERAAR